MTTPVLNKAGLRTIIAGLTSLSDGATVWALDPQPFIGDQDRARVVLELFSMTSLGVDEHRRWVSDGTDGYAAGAFVTQELGNRHLVITVRAEAFDASVEASEILDQIKTGIRTQASTDALNAINLAVVWMAQAMRVRYEIDNRSVNAAIADFTFAGIAQQVTVIPPGVGGDYVAVVNGNNVVPGTYSQ